MSDSDAPGSKSSSSNGIKIQLRGASLKTITMIVAILLGSGGTAVGVFEIATQGYVDGAIDQSMTDHTNDTYPRLDELERKCVYYDNVIDEHEESIQSVHIILGEVQTVQRQQFARDEARRITDKIHARVRREAEYDRLVDRNMWRLEKGKPPCSTVECPD